MIASPSAATAREATYNTATARGAATSRQPEAATLRQPEPQQRLAEIKKKNKGI